MANYFTTLASRALGLVNIQVESNGDGILDVQIILTEYLGGSVPISITGSTYTDLLDGIYNFTCISEIFAPSQFNTYKASVPIVNKKVIKPTILSGITLGINQLTIIIEPGVYKTRITDRSVFDNASITLQDIIKPDDMTTSQPSDKGQVEVFNEADALKYIDQQDITFRYPTILSVTSATANTTIIINLTKL